MNFKTDEQGVYVRKCRDEEFVKKATRLSRMARIALTNENVQPTYEIIYFTQNKGWSKFDDKYSYIVCRFFTDGELLDIVDKTRGVDNYLGREAIFKESEFKVICDEVSYKGNLYLENLYGNDIIEVWFSDTKSNLNRYEKFRFIPRVF